MLGRYTKLILLLLLCPSLSKAEQLWQQVAKDKIERTTQVQHPTNYLVYRLNESPLKLQMWNLSSDPMEGMIITLPQPDGKFRDFKIWQTPMLPQDLSVKYPDIRTFTGGAVDDPTVTAKLDFTTYGFHAMVFDGAQTAFIDPLNAFNDGYYMVHYKKDEIRAASNRMRCLVHREDEDGPGGEAMVTEQRKLSAMAAAKTINGYQLRTYRLALSANSFYCQAAPVATTKTQALSKMTTTMNRVNGVYEREFSVTMAFVSSEDNLIWLTSTGDPFYSINSNAGSCLSQNQTQCDAIIGAANYDIGHVFTTGAGGLSLVGCVCQNGTKAQSVTGSPTPVGDGFDIDFVAHEIGHEYGGDHTFNNNMDNNCAGNAESGTAYEPGSGSTIMAYAGICAPDNLQPHSDPYFHTGSLVQMYQYIAVGQGNTCPAKTATDNKPVGYPPFAAIYSIPYLTPFELTGPALTDSTADSVKLYCWEEWDLGDFGQRFTNTTTTGPNFRSFSPTKSATRVFPKMSMVLNGSLSDAGTNNNEGEKAPTVARTLTFKCTFRNIRNNKGCFTLPDDQVTLNAVLTGTGTGFKVTSQSTIGNIYNGGSTQSVTWTVLNTNTAPINASQVDIYMSTNNGNSWQYHIGTFPNNGSATVTLPNPAASSTTVRFKVKGTNNVFFNVNSANFTVTNNPSLPVTPTDSEQVTKKPIELKIFPNPARDVLHFITNGTTQSKIFNVVGQMVWEGTIYNQLDLPVKELPRGVYCIVLIGDNKERIVRRIVLD